jgi:serine phosphatase RsbU (regulator of sigma subunit)
MMNVNQLTMEEDDIMLLYTDGIVEAKDKRDEMYSNEKLVDVFKNLCLSEKSPTEIKSGILDSLKNFNCKDDVTLVILKKSGTNKTGFSPS